MKNYEYRHSSAHRSSKKDWSYLDSIRQEQVERDIRRREADKDKRPNDKGMFDEGRIYFIQGYAFDEINEKLKADKNFEAGYYHEAKMAKINEDLYQMGLEFAKYHNEIDIKEIYAKNPYFMEGFKRGKNKAK